MKPRYETSALKDRKSFRESLVSWFATHCKDYPWRRTIDPYEILVSEVMLQQTQISTVLGKGYFTRFLTSFPDVKTLAAANDANLLKAWEGLGYYRRARMLRDTAQAVIAGHGGAFPDDLENLLKLPGIGRYTAGALRAFAFGLPAVLVDGNVVRVISRLMDFSDPSDETAGLKRLWSWAENLACGDHPREYHAALMELGQTVCRPGIPDCLTCPVARFCRARSPENLPVKTRKTQVTAVEEHALWVRDGQGRVLLHHEAGKRRTGLWKLPVREVAETEELPILLEESYSITRYRVTLCVHRVRPRKSFPLLPGDTWIDPENISSLAMATPFRRVVERLLRDS